MTSIDKIPDISAAEKDALTSMGIHTITDLWENIGTDYDEGIDILARKVNIRKSRLVELLKTQALVDVESKNSSWFVREWLPLNLLAFSIIIVGLFAYSVSQGSLDWWLKPQAEVKSVNATRDLPAFHLLTEGDLLETYHPAVEGAFQSTSDLIGRFTLREVISGTTILESWVSPLVVEPSSGYTTVSLPVADHMLALAQPGYSASIILTPRDPEHSCSALPAPIDIIVLAEQQTRNEYALIIALQREDLNALQNCLGYSDVIILQENQP